MCVCVCVVGVSPPDVADGLPGVRRGGVCVGAAVAAVLEEHIPPLSPLPLLPLPLASLAAQLPPPTAPHSQGTSYTGSFLSEPPPPPPRHQKF